MRDETNEREVGRPGTLVGLIVGGVFLGASLGAATNAVNGRMSPEYFRAVMGWRDVQDVARASIAQGIFEGLMFGLGLSLILAVTIAWTSRLQCSMRHCGAYLLGIGGAALACWAIGGLIGLGLAALSPEFFGQTFRGAPKEGPALLRFAWVGGSIQGLELGGIAAVVAACVNFRVRWRPPAKAAVP